MSTSQKPWYEPKEKNKSTTSVDIEKRLNTMFDSEGGLWQQCGFFLNGVASVFMAIGAGFCFSFENTLLGLVTGGVLAILAFLLLFKQIGQTIKKSLAKYAAESAIPLAFQMSRGALKCEDVRKGVPAPEQALLQFVQQVRAYANEKSFQKVKLSDRSLSTQAVVSEPVDLLKRRWNEVVDSLSEFEIYLANDPQGIIDKLISKNSMQLMDLSQIFREVADSFDVSWRRKGINIESAIVTPLKATTSEAFLRRILVGPWRTTAYFARRGGGVIFSAKSDNAVVIARWECEGIGMPESYVKYAMDSTKSVNERLEKGLVEFAAEGNNPNILFGLTSFLTWLDLANAGNLDYEVKLTDDGFAIVLKLK